MIEVSVIIPYFKKDKFIIETIYSIKNQTLKNFEIIIIDDELTENSNKILSEVKKIDNRIKVYKNDFNSGAGLSRNLGIQLSKGKFVAFCDADDLWESNKLEKQIEFMKKTNSDFCFTSYKIINEYGNYISLREAKKEITFDQLKKSCDIGLSTVIINKKILNDKKLRFVNLVTKEDYVLWLLIAKKGFKLNGYNKLLSSWRKTNNSLSSSIFQKLFDGFKVYNVYLKFGKIRSLLQLLILSLNYLIKKND